MLKTRIKTIVILNIVIIPLVWFSYMPYLMNTATSVLSIAAIYEIYSLLSRPVNYYMFIISSAIAVAINYFDIPFLPVITAAVLGAALIVSALLMKFINRIKPQKTPAAVFISLFIPLFYRSIPELRKMEDGMYIVFLMIIESILTEMGGYFIGRKFGKHKLAPVISPNKTWEGAIGGTAAAVLLLNVIAFICSRLTGFSVSVLRFEIYLILGSLIGQYADLSTSVIKRVCGVKDYGEIFPGHGGVLDRFDSQLYSAPFTLVFISLAGPVIG